jgi:hypothetical protein
VLQAQQIVFKQQQLANEYNNSDTPRLMPPDEHFTYGNKFVGREKETSFRQPNMDSPFFDGGIQ